VILSGTDEDEVREMLLRLQNGTTLKAQQRRNAMSGKMRDFIKDLAEHQFFDTHLISWQHRCRLSSWWANLPM
jgi:hypothetical protein